MKRPPFPALAIAAAFTALPVLAQDVIYIDERPVTTTYYYSEPPLVVEAEPLSEDQAINRDVVDTLAADDRLSGRIGVETYDRRVELSGIVTTPGQARIAARDAMSVPGVREVESQLRTRVGGSGY